jgi:protocatechuate 3,4-dioxygenase beta subunit
MSSQLSRRELLMLGAACLACFATHGISDARTLCVVRPQQTEGPYFVDEELNRSDIRRDPATGLVKVGTPLALTLAVSQISGNACKPLPSAQIDIWHCDAQGMYSDVMDPSFDTKGHKFLRGFQRTAADGKASFTTIYPGWYEGRAVHIHFKIRTTGHEFTSQLYFPDSLTDRVQAAAAYKKSGTRTRNGDDGIFANGGADLILDPTRTANGYSATFSVALVLSGP